jgi:hypothetical protein
MSLSNDDFDVAEKLMWISQRLNGIVDLPVVVLGRPANLLIILYFVQLKSLNKWASSLFLVGSIISGQLVLFALIPRIIFGLTGNDPTNNSLFLCKTRLFIGYSCSGFSISCTCLNAIDQYLLSCPQVSRHRLLTRRRAYYTLLFLALFWLIAYLPHTIFYTLIPLTNETFTCVNTNSIYGIYVTYFALIVYSVFPVIVLTLFSLLILINVRRFRHIRQQSSILQKSVRRMTIAFIIIIYLAALPTSINQLYMISTHYFNKSRLQISIEYLILTILSLLVYSSYGATYYMFILISFSFRQKNKKVLCKFFNYFHAHNRRDRVEPQPIPRPPDLIL